jgi:periplasmic divalent cation tolerance protein
MESKYSIYFVTFPDKESARQSAKMLVEKHLAACAQMIPIESIYCWQDKVCEDSETILCIKSKTSLIDEIICAIREIHTYEVPEIVKIPISDGLPEYLKWIDDNTIGEA